ncbi:response regulator transcription factor [Polynucleobacter sp. Fuers-14]|uniref:response regulator transcription factor n=1 Tax=Polynucleobacter sp. Fuers-14 TaxID=1758364 RepID=UPI001C0D666F|nr:LuxR C-terminal-related transcriptional regulator [Polynucleobacter sp. Fuers-14]MBU3641367.1 hypothetical protein [Polynucleobacter sp. Fuers-14]
MFGEHKAMEDSKSNFFPNPKHTVYKLQNVLRNSSLSPQNCSEPPFLIALQKEVAFIRVNDSKQEQLRILSTIKSHLPNLRIVFIGGLIDAHQVIALFRSGLSDYLQEPTDDAEIYGAAKRIRDFVHKRKYCPSDLGLSKREAQVCDLLVKGFKNVEIAAELNISPATVKVHKSRVLQKAGARTLPDLVRLVSI